VRAGSGSQFDPAVVEALLEAVAPSGAPDCQA
jgi:HD-GYP domain-containing protein (c-di-GMP phosphodiesterase class II)